LWHQQQATLNIAQRKIHPSLLVGKYAVGQHALEQAIGRLGVVSASYADEGQRTALYSPDDLGIHLHVRPGNALN
jgi:hypothetical protein